MKNITIIGAGKTGRGFIGRLLNGNNVDFIDKNIAPNRQFIYTYIPYYKSENNVFYGKEEGVNTLRLVIDKQGYININDCVKVNEIVNPILDKEDPISESYVLDVCSKEKGSEEDGQ